MSIGRGLWIVAVASVATLAVMEPFLVSAQEVAREAPVSFAEYSHLLSETTVEDGQIVTLEEGELKLADEPYSSRLHGIVVFNPAVAISYIGKGENIYPIATTGTVRVLVSAQNGPIARGDFVTSSATPGLGMKATQAGFVVGVAQAPFVGEQEETGVIPVSIDIRFLTHIEDEPLTARAFMTQIQNALTVGLRAVATEPNTALRYMAAALVLIAAIAFGFLVFGRSATNGVMAIGRNPLAKKSILVMMLFNIGMTTVFIGAGLALALFILAA